MNIPFPSPSEKDTNFTFIDLFAGIGGFRIALQNLGGKCVFSSEIDEAAKTTYEYNFGERPVGDIKEITNPNISDYELDQLIPDHDILTAGFPCQAFSIAGVSARQALGKSHGFEDLVQGTLFFDIVRIAKVKKPKVLFLENVKNFKSHDKGNTFKVVKEIITNELGYTFNSKIIDPSSLVPQKRLRCYMVCFKYNLKYNFPDLDGNPKPLASVLEEFPSEDYTISDRLWEGHINRSKRNKDRGTGFVINLADINKPSATIVSRYYKDGKECLIPQYGKNPRMLTPRECARLQGFPENFLIHKSKIKAYQQFGNSVVVPLIYKIANKFIDQLKQMSYLEQIKKEGYKLPAHLSIWEKCYWYLRYLVQYRVHDNHQFCESLSEGLITTYKWSLFSDDSEETTLNILNNFLREKLLGNLKKDSSKENQYNELYLKLLKFFTSPKDYYIFAVTINEIILPTNQAIANIPSNDDNISDFANTYAKAVLDEKKEKGLKDLIRNWDELTGMLAMNRERDIVVELYQNVRERLQDKTNIIEEVKEDDFDFILTALCQEYERRAGQKRKHRAGNDLESSTKFILDYFEIPTGGKPRHFSSSFEVDNWIITKQNNYIGICLKRTLRERWKQTNPDTSTLRDNNIISLIHVISDDSDLSEDKVLEMGRNQSILFLPDESIALKRFNNNEENSEIKEYVYPMTELIKIIKQFIKNK